ncbi:LytTR family DNA-binding domain-containing protein [[Clostridium] polysaccharolyticum]|uniref:LytTr DNA-binding domain-containing protein n=1 Tax=[Clostridium] polysaccharolyticum TaxID=29364 RepID=A0A1H9YKB7_9FIRM|nr:LytTR family DNA-binding domain-containing protein [[Clostridium] polysaccharolyticum]SES69515.1 LytTr DNA-binding domain-containing protein [[Clostridium] polysaccharolyticum]
MVNVLLILAFVAEPLLWYQSAKSKFYVKSKKAIQLFMLIDLVDSLLNQYTKLANCTILQTFHSLVFFTYITVFICYAFEGSIKSKLKHTGTMFLVYLASDIIAMLILSIFATVEQISGNGILNAAGMLLSKIVMFCLIQIIIKRSVSISSEMIPFAFLMIAMEIPLVVMFKSSCSGSIVNIVMCTIIQMTVVAMICYVQQLLCAKNTIFANFKKKEAELEKKTIKLHMLTEELKELKLKETNTQEKTEKNSSMLEFTENRKKIYINRDSILYVERYARKIIIIEQDGQKHEINSSIAKMFELLGEQQFKKINQGILVNRKYIINVDKDCVKLKNGTVLYASKKMMKEGEL